MANVLIFSDKTTQALELISAGKMIADTIYAVTLNDEEQARELEIRGVQVLKIEQAELCLVDTAAVAAAIVQGAEYVNAETVLLGASRIGKEVAGRIAQKMEAGCLVDLQSISVNNGDIEGTRNALGGATLAVQAIKSANKVLVISPKAFSPAQVADGGKIEDFDVEVKLSGVKVVEIKEKASENAEIEAAEVLVVVGQGMDRQETLTEVKVLAKSLNGEIACTKPLATDKAWLSEARVIGISGKTCKPDLAILMGVSGQVQFTVGIRDAKTIITVNNDENAAICSMSDYILHADMNEAIPELLAQLK